MQYVAQGITDVPFHGADMEKKFEIVKYVDPRFDCNNAAYIDNRYVVVSGGPQISRYDMECDEYSDDIIRWGNKRTLGSKFLYDSHWYIHYTVDVKINFRMPWNINTDDGDWEDYLEFMFKNAIGFKPFPLTQAARSIQLKLNDKEISCLPRESLAARMEYWDPKALYKGCSTCPCERPNVQSVMQFNEYTMSSPFRGASECLMGEKSNVVLPYSQCQFHIIQNGVELGGNVNNQHECVFCGVEANQINLPWEGLEGAHPTPNEFYFLLRASMYEPVLIEPLTFTNGSEFNPPMWNLDNFELTYNMDDLRNMIWIDKYKIVNTLCRWNGVSANLGYDGRRYTCHEQHIDDDNEYENAAAPDVDNFENEYEAWNSFINGLKVRLVAKPKLVYYVYTPIPGNEPRLPYMAPYKEFKRYKYGGMDATVNRRALIEQYRINQIQKMSFDTGRIDMVYYPHSIYIYVAEANDKRNNSVESKVCHAETFAKIKKITCIYGNCTTILDSFEEIDFYNMSIRNGLKGRTFADWNMMNVALGCSDMFEIETRPENNSNVAGVGSVVRLTPGIDLHTGGMTGRMIGGCPAVSKSITFKVDAEPLDIYTQGNKVYELYVIFEQQGALVMQDGQCRVGLVGCESVEWYDMQPLAQVTCDYNMYGSEIGGGNFFAKARKVLKKGANVVRKAAEHNMFSRGLGMLGEVTGNQAFNKWADRARKVEGLVPKKKQALMDANAPPTGSGYKRRFYH